MNYNITLECIGTSESTKIAERERELPSDQKHLIMLYDIVLLAIPISCHGVKTLHTVELAIH